MLDECPQRQRTRSQAQGTYQSGATGCGLPSRWHDIEAAYPHEQMRNNGAGETDLEERLSTIH
jgi:hypothetical protein